MDGLETYTTEELMNELLSRHTAGVIALSKDAPGETDTDTVLTLIDYKEFHAAMGLVQLARRRLERIDERAQRQMDEEDDDA